MSPCENPAPPPATQIEVLCMMAVSSIYVSTICDPI